LAASIHQSDERDRATGQADRHANDTVETVRALGFRDAMGQRCRQAFGFVQSFWMRLYHPMKRISDARASVGL
jgi:hypothetical protein